MSLRADTAQLLGASLLASTVPGLGVRADAIPSGGTDGPAFLFPCVSLPTDAAVEIRALITRWPTLGTLVPQENGAFTYTGATDYFDFRLYIDGVASTVDIGFGPGIGRVLLNVNLAPSTTLLQDLAALLGPLATGGAWYGMNTQDPPVYPYITFMRISSVPNVTLDGASDLQNTRVQIDIIARDVAGAVSIESALESAFFGWTVANVPLSSQDQMETELRAYRITKDYSIWATN
jgi:hypothetical protein